MTVYSSILSILISKKLNLFLQSCDNSPSLLYFRNRSHTFHSFLWNRQIKMGVFLVSWRIQALIFKVQLVIHGKLININFKTMVWSALIVLPLAAFSSILPLSHTSWNTPRSSLWQDLFVSCMPSTLFRLLVFLTLSLCLSNNNCL